jgi:hypothetical protein
MEKMQNYPNSSADLQDQLDCAQRSLADLRKDIRTIVREELHREYLAEECRVIKDGNSEEVIN